MAEPIDWKRVEPLKDWLAWIVAATLAGFLKVEE